MKTHRAKLQDTANLDLFLERRDGEGFHNRFRWLCLDLGLLAEHHPYARLGGRLRARLDAANSWEGENARLFHLARGQGHETADHLGASLLLQAVLVGNGFRFSFAPAFIDFMGGNMIWEASGWPQGKRRSVSGLALLSLEPEHRIINENSNSDAGLQCVFRYAQTSQH